MQPVLALGVQQWQVYAFLVAMVLVSPFLVPIVVPVLYAVVVLVYNQLQAGNEATVAVWWLQQQVSGCKCELVVVDVVLQLKMVLELQLVPAKLKVCCKYKIYVLVIKNYYYEKSEAKIFPIFGMLVRKINLPK